MNWCTAYTLKGFHFLILIVIDIYVFMGKRSCFHHHKLSAVGGHSQEKKKCCLVTGIAPLTMHHYHYTVIIKLVSINALWLLSGRIDTHIQPFDQSFILVYCYTYGGKGMRNLSSHTGSICFLYVYMASDIIT